MINEKDTAQTKKKDYSNVILIILLIATLFSLGSVKAVPREESIEEQEIVFEFEGNTMPEKVEQIQDYVNIALVDCGYEQEEIDVEIYPEHQEEGVLRFEILDNEEGASYCYSMDISTKEILYVESDSFIPYKAPTEYGEGYLTSEECLEKVLAYVGKGFDEVECLEIGDDIQNPDEPYYFITFIDGDYWKFYTIDATDGRIRTSEQSLVE